MMNSSNLVILIVLEGFKWFWTGSKNRSVITDCIR
jgi:hypothetical protein